MKRLVSDKNLRESVVQELEADAEVTAKHISVTAIDGAVALGGHVPTYHDKHAAVRAAERVDAVRAIADDIDVEEPSLHERADDEIAEEIAHLRGMNVKSADSVGVEVSDGRVILHGDVQSESQRAAIESATRQLTGVKAVSDLIEVKSQTEPTVADVERRVQAAVAQVAGADPRSIGATLANSTVRLHGHIYSATALLAAIDAAKTAPGVTAVESEIVVSSLPAEGG
jgi:osmotically-inducible protein OsmY